jgi:hypothetical protein
MELFNCVTDWGNILGIAESTLWRRLSSGWSIEDAFTKPIQQHRRAKMDVTDINVGNKGGESHETKERGTEVS